MEGWVTPEARAQATAALLGAIKTHDGGNATVARSWMLIALLHLNPVAWQKQIERDTRRQTMNPQALQREATAAARLREQIVNELDEDDADLLHDMIEGETSLLEIIERTVSAAKDDDLMAEQIGKRITQLQARKARYETRAKRMKRLVADAMHAAGLRKPLRYAEFTVSRCEGRWKVVVEDASKLLDSLYHEKVTREPDKAAIKELLDARLYVRGAHLEQGPPTISVRSG